MVGYACKWDGKKDKNKADHNVSPKFFSQGHGRGFSGHFLEGLTSDQMGYSFHPFPPSLLYSGNQR
jgi:hypothetical protein